MPRIRHAAGFLEGKFVVFGGSIGVFGEGRSDGAAFDLGTNTWQALPPLHEARCSHEAVSTGTSVLTFGGLRSCGAGNTNGPGLESLSFAGGVAAWSPIDVAGEPIHRYDYGAVWTGDSMFIYGGGTDFVPALPQAAFYSPATQSWRASECSHCGRSGGLVTFMDRSNIRIWGGSYPPGYSGSAYDIATESWSDWNPPGAPQNSGGTFTDAGTRVYALAGGSVAVYDKPTARWLEPDTASIPASVCEGSAAWSGSEMIVYSGECGGVARVGGRYQPAAPPALPAPVPATPGAFTGALAFALALLGMLQLHARLISPWPSPQRTGASRSRHLSSVESS